MNLVIVPNELSNAINKLLDEQLVAFHEIKPEDRKVLYSEILAYYDTHGALPSFTITRKTTA